MRQTQSNVNTQYLILNTMRFTIKVRHGRVPSVSCILRCEIILGTRHGYGPDQAGSARCEPKLDQLAGRSGSELGFLKLERVQ